MAKFNDRNIEVVTMNELDIEGSNVEKISGSTQDSG